MNDQMLDLTDPGDRIVGRVLQAYGEAHLSPSMAATSRMRMSVMSAAHRQAALIEADATFGAAGETTAALAARRSAAARATWRRPLAAVLAGCLTMAILVGTAFAAGPGGPLYAARLWTEMANLPADLVDRADAEAHRLERRIQEAQQASTAGDGAATEAALVAYSRIVVEAAEGTDRDPAAAAAIALSVTRHVAVLAQMVDSVPAPARAAIEQALSSSTMALDDLDAAGAKSGSHGGNGSHDGSANPARRGPGAKPPKPSGAP
jgi:hypothetical protein